MNDWQQINETYLAHSLHWLRLRLSRLAKTDQLDKEIDGEINAYAKKMNKLADGELLPSALLLSQLFGLSVFEQHVLLLCAAMELDTRIPALCAAAQDNLQRPYPTLGLALALFDDPGWDALSPERPLRYWQRFHCVHSLRRLKLI